MKNGNVAITGASGFVGMHLSARVATEAATLQCYSRRKRVGSSSDFVADICDVDWKSRFQNVDTVFHLAGLAHDLNVSPEEIIRVNVDGASAVAAGAVAAGVRKLIFLSTVKAQAQSSPVECLTEDQPCEPGDLYGKAKLQAELMMSKLCNGSDTALTVLRSPLVYGPEVRGNMLTLMRSIKRRVPLPFRNLQNRRSLIFVGNLVDGLIAVANREGGDGRTYLISDDHDVTTPELVTAIARAMEVRPLLFSFPIPLLNLCLGAYRRTDLSSRITGNLCVNIERVRNELGWKPPYTFHEGISETVGWFQSVQRTRA